MLKNHVLLALRRASKEKSYLAVNVLTLALGLASFLLIALYLRNELTYDRHHTDYHRIYRLVSVFQGPGGETRSAVSSESLGPLLVKEFPQLGEQIRFLPAPRETLLGYRNTQTKRDDLYMADPGVFQVFGHEIIQGDPKKALTAPFSIALSETVARYYFGDENPIGKTMNAAGLTLTVTLVFADLPQNTHLRYGALLSIGIMDLAFPGFSELHAHRLWSLDLGSYTYVKTPQQFDPREFPAMAAAFSRKYMDDPARIAANGRFNVELQPVADMHFGEKLQRDLPTGNIAYVEGFSAIALFVILSACINYTNLATARAARRSKEVGIRKVLGAGRPALVAQFLGESFLVTSIALVIAVAVAEGALSLTPIRSLMGSADLHLLRADADIVFGIVTLGVVVAVLSGLYPALYLSSIPPLAAIADRRRSWRAGFNLRQFLVGAQLAISIGVVASTALMTSQIRFIHEKPLGFEKDNRLIVTLYGDAVVRNLKTIKAELARIPQVLGASRTSVAPGTGSYTARPLIENTQGALEPMLVDSLTVDVNFLQSMKVPVIEGRGFAEDQPTDIDQAVVVNEALVRKMGWQQPLGKRISLSPQKTMRVIGVVGDFHYASLHNAVGPLVVRGFPEGTQYANDLQKAVATATLVIALSGERMGETLAGVNDVLRRFDATYRFEPEFLTDRLDQLYRTENRLLRLIAIFALVCMVISIVGVAALSSFMTEQRAREIGIRKVLGASSEGILLMLCRPLTLIVFIAAIPASLVTAYAMHSWLGRFQYGIELSAEPFLLAILLMSVIALLTLALQSGRALRSDPVAVLHQE